jgi:hypothetical protein
MSLKLKYLLLINTFLFLGYANILYADECGVLRYLANRSNGVAIKGNKCKANNDIAMGSEFNLMPGARLWFKSMDAEAKTQGICQNRSAKPIRINVDSNKLPWIKPSGLADCSSWVDNKMDCQDNPGGSNALSCVITTSSPLSEPSGHSSIRISSGGSQPSKGLEESHASVTMRSIPTIDDDNNEASQQGAETEKTQIILAMQPDISLCKAINHPNDAIKLTWLVEANSKVSTIIPDAAGANKPYIDCLTAVIKDFPYPPSSQAIWLTNQF